MCALLIVGIGKAGDRGHFILAARTQGHTSRSARGGYEVHADTPQAKSGNIPFTSHILTLAYA